MVGPQFLQDSFSLTFEQIDCLLINKTSGWLLESILLHWSHWHSSVWSEELFCVFLQFTSLDISKARVVFPALLGPDIIIELGIESDLQTCLRLLIISG